MASIAEPVSSQPEADTDMVLRTILRDILGLDQARVDAFDRDTELFGALPELDSMAVAGLLTEMEDRFDIVIEDEDVDGEVFENYGNLLDFSVQKVAA
ncbi:MAG: acyl carrier protein [Pseudomonadota bacterium]